MALAVRDESEVSMCRPFPCASRVRLVAGVLTYLVLLSCAPATWTDIGTAMAAFSSGASSTKIMLFGGRGHETYLGCLSCSEFSTESVFNESGRYGSPWGTNSIANKYGSFGSLSSTYSVCNPYASDPPVVVDQDGNYYGRLTVSRYRRDGLKGEFLEWITAVCAQ